MSNKGKRLLELRGSGYEVAKGQPDIRGWEVRDAHGRLMGKVHELIFDSRANKVRYMVINVADNKELQLEKRTVMVPIGLAVLQNQYDDVILPNVTPFQLRALPKYSKDDLGTKAELAINEVFGRSTTQPQGQNVDQDLDENFYNHDMYNENNMYSRRQQEHRMSEAEAASLRREANIYPANRPGVHEDGRPETEEEYHQRMRRERDRRM